VSTLRFDITSGDWIAFSPTRAKRPDGFRAAPISAAPPPLDREPNCPFCPGNESQATEPILVVPDPEDTSRWSVRVFPNKYPVLEPGASSERRAFGPLFREMDGHGRHELVVESPHHARELTEQPLSHLELLFGALQRRAHDLAADATLEVVQIFKNHGSRAGSSMPHPHFQILATPVVPRQIRVKYQMAAEYYNSAGVSLYTELCRAELDNGTRVISSNAEFVAFAPFAAKTPFEVWIVPRRAASTFEGADAASVALLPELLLDVLTRLRIALDDPPYNLVINSAPRRHADEPDFVWHIELLPRTTTRAGFELATGMAINTILPELAAETLRNAR
jgi:UDPglucose--hexose-1-phosphate uridylyltransferase